MNEKLAMLIGFLLSDGSVYYDKSKKTYCIQFTNKNSELLEVFKSLMTDCFGINKFSVNKCRNAVSLRVFSSKIAKELFIHSPSFRTQACNHIPRCAASNCEQDHPIIDGFRFPSCKVPEEILKDKNLSIAFLKGYVSGDGNMYVNKKYSIFRIEITCYHPLLKSQIADCLHLVGMESRIFGNRVIVSGRSKCQTFLDTINFIPEKSVVLSKS